MRTKQGKFYELMEKWINSGKPVPDKTFSGSELGYEPGPSLLEMARKYSGAKKYSLTYEADPKISVAGWKPITPPALFNVAAGSVWP